MTEGLIRFIAYRHAPAELPAASADTATTFRSSA
jgi:hypothetical protein